MVMAVVGRRGLRRRMRLDRAVGVAMFNGFTGSGRRPFGFAAHVHAGMGVSRRVIVRWGAGRIDMRLRFAPRRSGRRSVVMIGRRAFGMCLFDRLAAAMVMATAAVYQRPVLRRIQLG